MNQKFLEELLRCSEDRQLPSGIKGILITAHRELVEAQERLRLLVENTNEYMELAKKQKMSAAQIRRAALREVLEKHNTGRSMLVFLTEELAKPVL